MARTVGDDRLGTHAEVVINQLGEVGSTASHGFTIIRGSLDRDHPFDVAQYLWEAFGGSGEKSREVHRRSFGPSWILINGFRCPRRY